MQQCYQKHAWRYTNELKSFAVTLHYYSPQAYEFTWKILALLDPAKIRAWGASWHCEPGFLVEIMILVGEQAKTRPHMKDIALTVDGILLDNVLCYITEFIIEHLKKILPHTNCHKEMLLKADDHYRYYSTSITLDHLFLLHKQWGCLTFPSTAILKIIKMKEVTFKWRVIKNEKGITSERNLDLKIQSSILAQIGTDIFNNIRGHYADHTTREGDQWTSLLRLIVAKYVSIWQKNHMGRTTHRWFLTRTSHLKGTSWLSLSSLVVSKTILTFTVVYVIKIIVHIKT